MIIVGNRGILGIPAGNYMGKLHGKPATWKPARHFEKEGRGNHVNTEEQSKPEASLFNKEQMEMLQKLISNLQSTPSQTESSSNHVISFGTLAHKGNFLSAFTMTKKEKTWIVDSRASYHMTGDATMFDTYNPCHNDLKVRIADG